MFKKMLFVFVLAAAVLAFAGYGVPTAAACSGSVTSCNAMFGPGFETTLTVPASPSTASASNYATWGSANNLTNDIVNSVDIQQ